MNPESFELPPPQPQAEKSGDSPIGANPETLPSVEGLKIKSQPKQTVVTDSGIQSSVPATGTQDSSQVATSHTPTPIAADDVDLIEKEWVTKAKQIVSATRDDPHRQNQEINKFRADYLKKRYQKDIKVEKE